MARSFIRFMGIEGERIILQGIPIVNHENAKLIRRAEARQKEVFKLGSRFRFKGSLDVYSVIFNAEGVQKELGNLRILPGKMLVLFSPQKGVPTIQIVDQDELVRSWREGRVRKVGYFSSFFGRKKMHLLNWHQLLDINLLLLLANVLEAPFREGLTVDQLKELVQKARLALSTRAQESKDTIQKLGELRQAGIRISQVGSHARSVLEQASNELSAFQKRYDTITGSALYEVAVQQVGSEKERVFAANLARSTQWVQAQREREEHFETLASSAIKSLSGHQSSTPEIQGAVQAFERYGNVMVQDTTQSLDDLRALNAYLDEVETVLKSLEESDDQQNLRAELRVFGLRLLQHTLPLDLYAPPVSRRNNRTQTAPKSQRRLSLQWKEGPSNAVSAGAYPKNFVNRLKTDTQVQGRRQRNGTTFLIYGKYFQIQNRVVIFERSIEGNVTLKIGRFIEGRRNQLNIQEEAKLNGSFFSGSAKDFFAKAEELIGQINDYVQIRRAPYFLRGKIREKIAQAIANSRAALGSDRSEDRSVLFAVGKKGRAEVRPKRPAEIISDVTAHEIAERPAVPLTERRERLGLEVKAQIEPVESDQIRAFRKLKPFLGAQPDTGVHWGDVHFVAVQIAFRFLLIPVPAEALKSVLPFIYWDFADALGFERDGTYLALSEVDQKTQPGLDIRLLSNAPDLETEDGQKYYFNLNRVLRDRPNLTIKAFVVVNGDRHQIDEISRFFAAEYRVTKNRFQMEAIDGAKLQGALQRVISRTYSKSRSQGETGFKNVSQVYDRMTVSSQVPKLLSSVLIPVRWRVHNDLEGFNPWHQGELIQREADLTLQANAELLKRLHAVGANTISARRHIFVDQNELSMAEQLGERAWAERQFYWSA